MPHQTLAAVLLVTGLAQISHTLPISSDHQFTMFTPYWHQSSQPLVSPDFIQKRSNCKMDLCGPILDPLPQQQSEQTNSIPQIKNTKRGKNIYKKTGWAMRGMPFSVLYMNPKPPISVRSPVAEPLRSLSQIYDNGDFNLNEPLQRQNTGSNYFPPEIQAQPLTGMRRTEPTAIPTRKQYSIIPQLFVSYGWGPLGK